MDDDAPLGATGTLRYARSGEDAGTWATETVTTLIEEGSWCDIAVGTDGIVRIVFIAGDTLYYTHNTGGNVVYRNHRGNRYHVAMRDRPGLEQYSACHLQPVPGT